MITSLAAIVTLGAAPATDFTSLQGGSLFQTLLPGVICFAWPLAFLLVGVSARFAVGWRSRTAGAYVADVLLCTAIAGTVWLIASLSASVPWLQIIDQVFQRVAGSFAAGACGAAAIHIVTRRPIRDE